MKMPPMRHATIRLVLCLALLVTFTGCMDTVPITGRRQLSLVPASQLNSMAVDQYSSFLKENKLSKNAKATAMVKRCGRNIQRAVVRYFDEHGWSDKLKDYAWEYSLVESEQINAFCMPGGKVAIYTGILPVTKNETGLAVVMAHEIAHAVAQHSRERMSQQLLVSLGGAALGVALRDKSNATKSIFLGLYGAGATVGYMLPHSRQQELEADRLGLIFMAMAGYSPKAAIPFWERMAKANEGKGRPPAFLSTHPTNAKRIESIGEMLPEAEGYLPGRGK